MSSINSYISIKLITPGSQEYTVTLNEIDQEKKVTTTALNKIPSTREKAETNGKSLAERLKKPFIQPVETSANAETVSKVAQKASTTISIEPAAKASSEEDSDYDFCGV